MMVTLTWRGEDELHGEGQTGPSSMTWKGIKFPKGEPVEVSDKDTIARASKNKFFKVEANGSVMKRGPGRPPKPKDQLITAEI